MTSEEYKVLEAICKKNEALNLNELLKEIKEKALDWERRCSNA